MKLKHRSLTRTTLLSVLAILGLILAPGAQGQQYATGTFTWDNGNTPAWSAVSGSSYTNDWTPGGNAILEGTPGTVSVAATGATAHSITFNSTGYLIQNNTLTLTNANPVISDGSGFTNTISSALVGTNNLYKMGLGTVNLTGTNTYTGSTTVSNGVLGVGNWGPTTVGALNVGYGNNNTAVLNITGGTLNLGANAITLGNSGTGQIAIINQSGGIISYTSGSGLLDGNGAGRTCTYNLSGGTLSGYASTSIGVMLGVNASGNATFNLSGAGNLAMGKSALQLGRADSSKAGCTVAYNQSGGTAVVGTLVIGGGSGSTSTAATFIVTNGTFVATNFTVLVGASSSSATMDLGGSAQVTLPAFPTPAGTANLTLDFTTGYLSPYAASANYMSGLTAVYLTTNGVNFNVASTNSITVAQALKNAPSEAGTLTKTGNGTLMLTGANTYTGITTVSAGTLDLGGTSQTLGPVTLITGVITNGTLTGTSFAAQSGVAYAILAGSGAPLNMTNPGTLTLFAANTYSGPTTVTAGELCGVTGGSCNNSSITFAPGTGVATTNAVMVTTAGGQWTCASLTNTAGSGTIYAQFDFGGVNGPSPTAAPLLVNGNASVSGTLNIIVNGGTGWTPGQTYPLVQIAGSAPANIALNLISEPTGNRYGSVSYDNIHQVINYTVGIVPQAKTWNVGSSVWDVNTSFNWLNASLNPAIYLQYDMVTFNDTPGAGSFNVTINTNVTPYSMTVNANTANYIIMGSGGISGPTAVNQSGSASLVLSNANSYTGGTIVSNGTLVVGNASAIGFGPLSLAGGNLDSAVTNLVNANNNAQNWISDFAFNGSQSLNLGSGPVTLASSRQVTVKSNTLTVAGPITDSGMGFALTKVGNGTLNLACPSSSYSGGTTVSAGTLQQGAANALGSAVNNLEVDATLDLNGFPLTINGLNGGNDGIILNNAGSGQAVLAFGNGNAGGNFSGEIVDNSSGAGTVAVTLLGGYEVLSGSNSYSGPTTLTGGTLSVTSILNGGVAGGNLGAASAGATNIVFSGGTLEYGGITNISDRAFTINSNVTATIQVDGASLTLAGASGASTSGALTKTGTGILALSGANTYTGQTTVTSGELDISNWGATTVGAIAVAYGNNNTGILGIMGGTLNLGANTLTLGNTATAGQVSIVNQSGGVVSFTNGNALLVGNGAGRVCTYNLSGGTVSGYPSSIRGVILGVNTGGDGTFNLSGTGNLAMGNAALEVGRSDAANGGNGLVVYNQTGGAAVVGYLTIGGGGLNINGIIDATFSITGGTFSATNFVAFLGNASSTATMDLGGSAQVTLPAFPTPAGSATLTLDFTGGYLSPVAASTNFMSGLTDVFLTTNGVDFNVASGNDITVAQVLEDAPSQTGILTKSGTGTLTLAGVNTYSGNTTNLAGTLLVNGALGSGAINVVGGTFGGAGIIGGPVSVAAGATLTAGASLSTVGTLTINNSLSINGNLLFNLNESQAQSNSLITVSGALTCSGTGTLTVSNLGPALNVGDQFQLFNIVVPHGDNLTIVPPAGYTFVNRLAENGSITVATVPPPVLGYSNLGGGNLQFSWTGGYRLQSQTNALNNGLGTNWSYYPGGGVSPVNITLDPTQPSVFFRLSQ